MPACAPEDLSNRRFYDALKGRAWLNNATAYGHIDVLDAGAFSDIGEVTNHQCPISVLNHQSIILALWILCRRPP